MLLVMFNLVQLLNSRNKDQDCEGMHSSYLHNKPAENLESTIREAFASAVQCQKVSCREMGIVLCCAFLGVVGGNRGISLLKQLLCTRVEVSYQFQGDVASSCPL